MKKLIKYILLFVITFTLFACGESTPSTTVVQMDINPSVEIIVDKDKKVLSITALNDDAAVVIVDEVFVGLSLEEATDKYLGICIRLGYIKDDETVDVTLYVSGSGTYAKDFKKELITSINGYLEESGIKSSLKKAKEFVTTGMEKELLNCGYDQETLKGLSTEELIELYKNERVKTAIFLTRELRDTYYRYRNAAMDLAKYTALNTFSETLEGTVKTLYTVSSLTYNAAYKSCSVAIDKLNEQYYDTFISSSGAYQQALAAVLDLKEQVLEKERDLESVTKGSVEYVAMKEVLDGIKASLDAAISSLDAVKELTTSSVSQLDSSIKSAMDKLDEEYAKLMDTMSKFIDTNALTEVMLENISDAMQLFAATFYHDHKSDIDKLVAKYRMVKDELIMTEE